MTLLSILVALIIEQIHSLPVKMLVRNPVDRMTTVLESRFNDGQHAHGVIAWSLAVALPSVLVMVLQWVADDANAVFYFLLSVVVLYLTMGFRQFSHYFTDIQMALRAGELDAARRLLAAWRGSSGDRLTPSEVARLAIEQALVNSHRHVFAPLLWFVIAGPAGAVLYRLAQLLDEQWSARQQGDPAEMGRFADFAQQAFRWIDYLPLRITASAFAVAGDFEDAVSCWRTQASRWPEGESGILLASGAGALGVKLGSPVSDAMSALGDEAANRPELGLGEDADPDFMESTVGLVWRSLVIGLVVLALISISNWVGG